MTEKQMPMFSVTSTNIKEIGYDASSRTLRVKFENASYDYDSVPPELFKELLSAKSVGGFFFAKVKGKFGCTKL